MARTDTVGEVVLFQYIPLSQISNLDAVNVPLMKENSIKCPINENLSVHVLDFTCPWT